MELILSIIAVIISAISIIWSAGTHVQMLKRERKQATLEAYNRLEAEALEPLDKFEPKQIREISKNTRSEEYKTVSALIARVEHFCVGVNEKIYDADVLYQLAHGFLDGRIMSRIQPMIDSKQKNAEEMYFENIEKVICDMKNRSKR